MKNMSESFAEYIESVIIVFDSGFKVQYNNRSAQKVLMDRRYVTDILNEHYIPIFKNGVENKFPFIIKEHYKKQIKIFNTVEESFRLTVSPLKQGFFILEGTNIDSINKANIFLRLKTAEYEKKLKFLNKLINIKSEKFMDFHGDNRKLLEYYEEQLHFELSMDAALSQIYEPLISHSSTIKDIAETVISQAKKLTGSLNGYVFSRTEEMGEKYICTITDISSPSKIGHSNITQYCLKLHDNGFCDGIWGEAINKNEGFYTNTPGNFENTPGAQDAFPQLTCFLAVPVALDKEVVGQIVLTNAPKGYSNQDLRAMKRLAQYYALAVQRKRDEEKLEKFATTDPMTGVYNRRTGLEFLQKFHKLAVRKESRLTICFIDINGLKKVNDTYGHTKGDSLICTVSESIKKHLRSSDVVARLGGDEFLVIFPDTPLNSAKEAFSRIHNNFKQTNSKDIYDYDVSISYGFAEYLPSSPKTADQLLEAADREMYTYKKQK